MGRVIAIIPARMGSSRFPGKPLASILGRPMIEHVYRRVALSRSLDSVTIATCDEEIREVVESFNGRVVMTSPRHERASERVAEAAADMEADIVVMVQGDEPMTVPEMIDQAVEPFQEDASVGCVNLIKTIERIEEFEDPNTIKVVKDRNDNALFFSREPIPTGRLGRWGQWPVYKQICIIPFRRELLLRYARLKPTPLEQTESIDMLRLLEHGIQVRLRETHHQTHAVDTPNDLERVEAMLKDDPLLASYSSRNQEGSQV